MQVMSPLCFAERQFRLRILPQHQDYTLLVLADATEDFMWSLIFEADCKNVDLS
jgi:hypothetical protein